MDIIVIGAGLAGLTAAKVLHESGVKVRVLEAENTIGGRVRSRKISGFTLDRGFQVLFTAYPSVKRHLDLARLDLTTLLPAAVIHGRGWHEVLGDPLRDPASLLSTVGAGALTTRDKVRVARLVAALKLGAPHRLLQGPDESTLAYLQRNGFSARAIRTFFAPFFGGIFLNRELSASARLFRYYFRMLIDGSIAVPRGGIGAVTAQLGENLEVHTRTRAEYLTATTEGVEVHTDQGTLRASHVIVATDPPDLQRLTGVVAAKRAVPSTYLYFGSETRLSAQPRLLLQAAGGLVNNALWASNANPALAPAGQHLLSVTVLGRSALNDDALEHSVRAELSRWYGDAVRASKEGGLRLLDIVRLPHAQFAQPPGFSATLLSHETALPHVLIASEATSMSSVQGAMESGEKAAAILLGDATVMGRARGA